jgi:hypothetical protein
MRGTIQAAAAAFLLSVLLTPLTQASEHRRVDFGHKPGDYFQTFELGSNKYVEIAKVDNKGLRTVARGLLPDDADLDRLTEVKANFGGCGNGTIREYTSLGTAVFSGFDEIVGDCPMQNPPNNIQRFYGTEH